MKIYKKITCAPIAATLIIIIVLGCAKTGPVPHLTNPQNLTKADAIVVLGHGPPVDKNGNPDSEIIYRVTAGVKLYNQGLAKHIIMTGGNTYQDYYESFVMKEVSILLGVPEDAVIEEREAMDTIDNARYTRKIMDMNNWKSCIIVSSPYHLERAKKLFEAADIEVQTFASDTPETFTYAFSSSVYEYLVKVHYFFIDEESLVQDAGNEK